MATKHYISAKDRFEILKFIEARIIPVADGMCQYKPGWSDEACLRALNHPELKIHVVRAMRQSTFGKTRTLNPHSKKPSETEELRNQVAELRAQVAAMQAKPQDTANLFRKARVG